MSAAVTRVDDPVAATGRLLREQILAARAELGDGIPDAAEIHTARKLLKKARATLRLLRDSLTDAAYQRENMALRDAARPLSRMRDADVLLHTVDELGKHADDVDLGPLRSALEKRTSAARRTLRRERIAQIRHELATAAARVSAFRYQDTGWPVIERGCRRVYRRGRAAMKEARADVSSEALHEWRKQVKYLWHQLQVLEPLSPATLGELADECHRLADLLGDEHDLAMLRQNADEVPHGLNERAVPSFRAGVDRRRAQLQERALAAGSRIYADKPSAVAQRLQNLWNGWQAER